MGTAAQQLDIKHRAYSVPLDKKSGGALTLASTEQEPITGSGAEPPAGSRGRAPGQGVTGQRPLKLKALILRIGHPKEEANWPHVRVLKREKLLCY